MGALVLIEGQEIRTHRCEDGFPGVVVADVLEPFGKRPDNTSSLWFGWARARVARVPSRKGALDGRGGGAQKTMLLHVEDVPLLLARLDHRGMSPEVKELHTRFLKTCRDVLAQAFLDPRVVSAAPVPGPLSVPELQQVAAMAAALLVPVMRELLTEARRSARDEEDGRIGPTRARRILGDIREIAALQAQRGSKAWRAAHRTLCNELRDVAGLPLAGRWDDLPARSVPDLLTALDRIRRREADRVRAQRDLPFEPEVH